MNYSVVYATMTGHSRKLANSIADALSVSAENVKNKPEIINTDILFIVSGIYGGVVLPELLNFVECLSSEEVKRACLVLSSCGGDFSKANVKDALQKKGIEVIEEEYKCVGGFLVVKIGHPNKKEISTAVEFAIDITKKYSD
ncbi:MAG: flavodoxin domain-containing protein [Oscillospiraceae bacterium]|jgi:flavodoxin I